MESPVERKIGKCYGSVTVSERGQIVIPAKARHELGLEPGTKLLIFAGMGRKALIIIPASVVTEFIQLAMSQLSEFERALKELEEGEQSGE